MEKAVTKNKIINNPDLIISRIFAFILALCMICSNVQLKSIINLIEANAVSADYAFSPRFIEGKTKVSKVNSSSYIGYNDKDLLASNTGSISESNYFISRITEENKNADIGVKYSNVGTYNGKIIDMTMTATVNNIYKPSGASNKNAMIAFGKKAIKIYATSFLLGDIKVTCTYYDQNGNEISIPSNFTVVDIDPSEKIKMGSGIRDIFKGEDINGPDTSGWYVSKNNCNHTTNSDANNWQAGAASSKVNGETREHWFSATVNSVSSFSFYYGHTYDTAYINARKDRVWYTFGIIGIPTLAQFGTPKLFKFAPSVVHMGEDDETFKYSFETTLPAQAEGSEYTEIRITDTLKSAIQLANTKLKVVSDDGKDVSSKFTLTQNDRTITIKSTDEKWLSASWKDNESANKTYTFTINVKPKTGYAFSVNNGVFVKNTAQIETFHGTGSSKTSYGVKESNEVSTEILFKVDAVIKGAGTIGDGTINVTNNNDSDTLTKTFKNLKGGTSKTITWKAAANHYISAVKIDGVAQTVTNKTSGSYTFNDIIANHTVKVFTTPVYNITCELTGSGIIEGEENSGAGTITKIVTIPEGETKTIHWYPAANWHVESVKIDGTKLSKDEIDTGKYKFTNISANHTVKVVTKYDPKITCTLKGKGEIEHKTNDSTGTITNVVAVPNGEDKYIHWYPATGWYVESVTVDGTKLSAEDVAKTKYQFTSITSDHTVDVVTKAIDTYNITTKLIGTGTIDPSVTNIQKGKSQTISWSAGTDYNVTSVKIDGVAQTISNTKSGSYAFNNIDKDHTVEVVTRPVDKYEITFELTGKGMVEEKKNTGTGTVSGAVQNLTQGATKTIHWYITDTSWYVGSVTVDGTKLSADDIATGKYKFENISDNHHVAVVMKPTYTVNNVLSSHTGGTGTITPSITGIKNGKSAVVEWSANSDSIITYVKIDGESQTITDNKSGSYTFSNINEDHEVRVIVEKVYNITCTLTGKGEIEHKTNATTGTITNVVKVTATEDKYIHWYPEAGWYVDSVKIDGTKLSAEDVAKTKYQFQNISANHTVDVVTKEIAIAAPTYEITTKLSSHSNGTGTITGVAGTEGGEGTVAGIKSGTSKKISWTAGADSIITYVKIDGVVQAITDNKSGSYTFSNVNEDHDVRVTVEKVFNITCTLTGKGEIEHQTNDTTGTITNVVTVPYDENKYIHWYPAEGWYVEYVKVDGVKLSDEEVDLAKYLFENVTSDHTVKVVTKPIHTITCTLTGKGEIEGKENTTTGTITNKLKIPDGWNKNVHWYAAEGWSVESVKVDGTALTDEQVATGKYTFEALSSDHTVDVVTKNIPSYTVNTTIATHSNGTGTITEPITGLKSGKSATVEWSADDDCIVTYVKIDGVVQAITDNKSGSYTFSNVNEDHEVKVTIEKVFNITCTLTGKGEIEHQTNDTTGTITNVVKVPYNENKYIHWYPATGWQIVSVTVDGTALTDEQVAAAKYQFENISADHTVDVVARPVDKYSVTTKLIGTGTITPTVTNISAGRSTTIEWSTTSAYKIKSITIDDVAQTVSNTSSGSYTFNNINENHTVVVVTEPLSNYDITWELTGHGHVEWNNNDGDDTLTGSIPSLPQGSTKTIHWGDTTGWYVYSVKVDGVVLTDEQIAETKYKFENISANHHVEVVTKPMFNITTKITGTGTGTITPSITDLKVEKDGSNKKITWTADNGCIVTYIKVDGESQPIKDTKTGSYTFSNIKEDHAVTITISKSYDITCTLTGKGEIEGEENTGTGTITNVVTIPSGWDKNIHWYLTDSKWYFDSVTIDGVALTADQIATNKYTFASLSSNHTVNVVTKPIETTTTEYKINYELTGKGIAEGSENTDTGTITGSISVPEGWNKYMHWYLNDSKWYFDSVTVDGVALTADEINENRYLFEAISSDHTVKIVTKPTYTVTTKLSGEGTGTITPTISGIKSGETATVEWTADDGNIVSYVKIDGELQALTNNKTGSYTFRSVNEDHEVKVGITPVYTINCELTGKGIIEGEENTSTGTITKTVTIPKGENKKIHWYLNDSDWYFDSVTVDGTPLTADEIALNKYSFDSLSENHTVKVVTKAIDKTSYEIVYSLTGQGHVEWNLNKTDDTMTGSVQNLPQGSQKTIHWGAADDWYVESVTVDGVPLVADQIATNKCTFTNISANHTVNVVTKQIEHTITFELTGKGEIEGKENTGTGTITGEMSVPQGWNKYIHWYPAADWYVDSVTIDGTALTADEIAATKYQFTDVREVHHVKVVTKPVDNTTFEITYSLTGQGHVEWNLNKTDGTMTGSVQNLSQGEQKTIHWAAADGWYVDSVTVDGTKLTADQIATNKYKFENISANHNVDVVTKQIEHTITFELTGKGIVEGKENTGTGTITGEVSVPEGWNKVMHWYLNDNDWYFDSVTIDGTPLTDDQIATNKYTFESITSDHTVKVVNKPVNNTTYKIDYSLTGHGHVEWNNNTGNTVLTGSVDSLPQGSTKTIHWEAAEDWYVESVTVDGTALTADQIATNKYKFENISANHNVDVVTKQIEHTITFELTGKGEIEGKENTGTGTITGEMSVPQGWNKYIHWYPAADWYVESVTIDGTALTDDEIAFTKYQFTDVREAHHVKVVTKPVDNTMFKITYSLTGHGHVEWNYNNGDTVLNGVVNGLAPDATKTIHWEAAEDWYVESVTVDGTALTTDQIATNKYKFEHINANHNVDVVTKAMIIPKLSLNKTSDKTAYNVGDVINYTVNVSQLTQDAQAENVVITDVLPDGVTIDKNNIHANNAVVTVANDKKSFTVALNQNLTGTYSFTYSVTVTDASLAGKNITNTVSATWDNNPKGDNPTASTTAQVLLPVVQVYKNAGKPGVTYNVKDTIPYEIIVRQITPNAKANDVVVSDRMAIADIDIDVNSVKVYDDHDNLLVRGTDYVFVNQYDNNTKKSGFDIKLASLTAQIKITYDAKINNNSVAGRAVSNNVQVTFSNNNGNVPTARAEEAIPEPVINIQKSINKNKVNVGDTASFTITAKQIVAGARANDVVITDNMIEDGIDLLYNSIKVTLNGTEISPAITNTTKGFVINIGNLSDTDTVIITYDGVVMSNDLSGHNFSNDASAVWSNAPDYPDGTNTTATGHVIKPELAVDKVIDDKVKNFNVGDVVDYIVTVYISSNTPGGRANNVVITDKISDGMLIDIDSLYIDEYAKDQYKVNSTDNSFVISEIAHLNDGETITIHYSATVWDPALAGRTFENTASAVCENNATPSENTVEASVYEPELEILKDIEFDSYNLSDVVNYTITVNQLVNNARANDVVITDVFDTLGVDLIPESIEVIGDADYRIYTDLSYADIPSISSFVSSSDLTLNQGFVIEIPSLEDSVVVKYQAKISDKNICGRSFTNVAFVTSSNYLDSDFEPIIEKTSVSANVYEPVLSIEKTADKFSYNLYETVHFTVKVNQTVKNAVAQGVVINDSFINEGIEFDPSTVVVKGFSAKDYEIKRVGNGYEIAFNKPIAYNQAITITYDAKITDPALVNLVLEHEVYTSCVTNTNTTGVWKDSVAIEVLKPDVMVIKTADKSEVYENEVVTYTVTLTQSEKGANSNSLVIEDTIEDNMSIDMKSFVITSSDNNADINAIKIEKTSSGFKAYVPEIAGENSVTLTYKANVLNIQRNSSTNIVKVTGDTLEDEITSKVTVNISKTPKTGENDFIPYALTAAVASFGLFAFSTYLKKKRNMLFN